MTTLLIILIVLCILTEGNTNNRLIGGRTKINHKEFSFKGRQAPPPPKFPNRIKRDR